MPMVIKEWKAGEFMLYTVSHAGIFLKIEVLREQINEGATVPTYIVKYPNGRIAHVSKTMFHKTEVLAWQSRVDELTKVVKDEERKLQEARHHLSELDRMLSESLRQLSVKGKNRG